MNRYSIVIWHGESATIYYVAKQRGGDISYIASFRRLIDANKWTGMLNKYALCSPVSCRAVEKQCMEAAN